MDNKVIAGQLLSGKKKSLHVGTLKIATAVRVAGHRLGGVLTVQKQKKGFLLIKSTAKVMHRKKAKKSSPGAKPSLPNPATLLHTSIRRSAAEVYAFVSNPKNMSLWAAGLGRTPLQPKSGQWIAKSPMGTVKIKFTPRNSLGVVDHEVTLPNGEIVLNPLRVQKNGPAAEVIFTLYRLPGVSEKVYRADAAKVRADLNKLKSLLES